MEDLTLVDEAKEGSLMLISDSVFFRSRAAPRQRDFSVCSSVSLHSLEKLITLVVVFQDSNIGASSGGLSP